MNRRDEIGEVLTALYNMTERLSSSEQDKLLEVLSKISVLFSEEIYENEASRENALRQIALYISKKTKEIGTPRRDVEVDSLSKLRNIIAHGKISRSEIRAYEPVVWRAITRSADRWHPVELSNFLAYCIGVREVNVDFNTTTPKKIINLYKALFNDLDERHRIRAFEELLMRLYSDRRMREIVG